MNSNSSRFLNSALHWAFEKKSVESWNIILNFGTFSVRGCWGQLMSFFWKLVDETQMCNPPEATRHHNLIKSLILLPLRAIHFRTFQCEIPCIRFIPDLHPRLEHQHGVLWKVLFLQFWNSKLTNFHQNGHTWSIQDKSISPQTQTLELQWF